MIPSAAAAAAPREPLGHAGRWIADADGKVVILHGFNTVPVDEQTLPRDIGMGPDNARWLAANGFNTIRLGLYYARVEPEPGVYDDTYLDDYLRVQRELSDEGIFTLLGMHQDQLHPRYGTDGPIPSRGFPDWFLKDDGLPNTATSYPQGYLTNPALNRAYDNIWQDFLAPDGISVQEHFATGWRRIAAAFKDRPGLLGYDFFNEPWPGTLWPTCASPAGCPPGGFDQTLLTAFNRKLVAALRAEDPHHLIFYEPNLQFDFGAQTQVGHVGDSNAGFSFHNYCLAYVFPGTPDSIEQCEVGERLVFDNAEAHSARTGDALLLSEIPHNLPSVQRMVKLAEEYMVSWQYWDYYGDHFDPADPRAAILVRPYPQLIAGTPQRWFYDDASKTFEFDYSTERAMGKGAVASAPARFPAGSTTEVFIPDRHYPEGYGVQVQGAAVVSHPGERLLVLRSCEGADTVRVRVTSQPEPATPCPTVSPDQVSDGPGSDGSLPATGSAFGALAGFVVMLVALGSRRRGRGGARPDPTSRGPWGSMPGARRGWSMHRSPRTSPRIPATGRTSWWGGHRRRPRTQATGRTSSSVDDRGRHEPCHCSSGS